MAFECGGRRDGQSRRTFIKTLGVLSGMLAGGGIASAAPSLSRSVRLQRSGAQLSLKQPIALQKLSRRGPKIDLPMPTPPTLGEPPLPSTRQRLLQTLFSTEVGLDPSAFKLARGANGIWQTSAPLTQVMNTDPLGNAYAQGVTLTPAGCDFVPATGLPPLG